MYWRVRLDDFSASLAGANTLTIVRLDYPARSAQGRLAE